MANKRTLSRAMRKRRKELLAAGWVPVHDRQLIGIIKELGANIELTDDEGSPYDPSPVFTMWVDEETMRAAHVILESERLANPSRDLLAGRGGAVFVRGGRAGRVLGPSADVVIADEVRKLEDDVKSGRMQGRALTIDDFFDAIEKVEDEG